jgi:hypothetical protein
MISLSFADCDYTACEINVSQPRSRHLTASGTRVSREGKHRVNEWLTGVSFHVLKQLVHLW